MIISFYNKSTNDFSVDYVYFDDELSMLSDLYRLENAIKEETDPDAIISFEEEIKSLNELRAEKVIEFNNQVLAATDIITQLLIAATKKN